MGVRITYNFDSWDAATITSTTEASTDLGDDNVVHDHVGKPWRTSDDKNEWVKFDLGSAVAITCFGMFNYNLSASATVRLQAHPTDDFSSPDHDELLTIPTDSDGNVIKRLVYFPSANNTKRWWRVTIDDYLTNADGYIQVGRIAAGAFYEPSRTISENFSVAMFDPSAGDIKPGRQTFFRQKNRYRRATVGFQFQDQTQHDKLQTVFEKVGNHAPVILALDPTDRPSKDSMYSYIVTPLDMAHQFAERFDTAQIVFEEKTE